MQMKLKIIAAVGILAFASAAVTTSYKWGYSSAQEKAAEQHAQALLVYQERLKADHRKALNVLKEDHKVALASQEAQVKIITETEEIVRYVEKEIKVPVECSDIEHTVSRVLIQTTDIIHRAARTGSN